MKNSFITGLLLLSFWQCIAQKKDLKKVLLGGKSTYTFSYIDIVTNKQNDKYVSGVFLNEFNLANHSVQTLMHDAYYISKINKLDSVEWLIKIAETSYDKIISMSSIATSNSCYITLSFEDSVIVNNVNYVSKGEVDILLMKIKSNGQFEYIKHIGSLKSEGFNKKSLAVDDNDNVYFVGSLVSQNNFLVKLIIGQDTISTNTQCGFITKIDANGNYLWAKAKTSNNGGQFGYGYLYYYQNYLYALGGSSISNFQIDSIQINIPFDFSNKNFVAKLDTSGRLQWARYFGVKSFGSFIPRDNFVADGNVYFAGGNFDNSHNDFYFQGAGFNPAASGFDPGGQWDYFIASYDTAGNYKWAKASQSYGDEVITQLGVDANNNLLATGIFDYTFALDTDTLYSLGGDDIFVTSLDSNGNYLWSTSAGGLGQDNGQGIATTTDGDIYVVGGTSSNTCYFGQDALQVDSLPSMFLAKIVNATPVDLQNFSKEDLWEVFPNPASTMLEIRCPMVGKKEIQLYNAVGQLVINLKTEHQTSNIETAKLPEGIYFLQLKQQGNTSTKKINIIH